MSTLQKFFVAVSAVLLTLPLVAAADSPQEQRHELMEDAGQGAKTIGKMIEGETAFDAVAAMEAMLTWKEVAAQAGDLFPEGSETGYDTKAKAKIWSDREGFNAALNALAEAVDGAIASNPQDLQSLQAAAGPVFKKCKACHEEYRVEDE